MSNRYHSYTAQYFHRINKNSRFSVLSKHKEDNLAAVARKCISAFKTDEQLRDYLREYQEWMGYHNDYRGKHAQQAWEELPKDNKETGEKDAWSEYRGYMNVQNTDAELQQKIDDAFNDPAMSAKIADLERHPMLPGTD